MPTYNNRNLFDVWKIRKQFPMLSKTMNGKPLIYLDSAATAQKPLNVIETINRFYREQYGTVHRAIYEIASRSTEMYSEVRSKIQKFIHANFEEEIIFTRGTTEAINLIAHSFGLAFLKEGDEILISEMEHHSNIVPWQLLCQRKKMHLRVIPILDDGVLDLGALKKMLSEKTKLLAITHLSNVLGTCNPIKEVIKMAHQVGAKVLVDGAQAAPHLPLDVIDLDVDFYAFSGHKLYGPTGIGVLYGKKELLELLPPFMGGGDMIEEVSFEKSTFQPPPLKFEAGTPSICQVIGLGAAIDYLESVGRKVILDWEQKLLAYAREKMDEISGIRIYGKAPVRGSLISFTIQGLHSLDLGTILGLKGIAIRTGHLCAMPLLKRLGVSSLVRASFAFYNTQEEIDLFVKAIKEASILLKPEMSY